jgi:hypothetical protein
MARMPSARPTIRRRASLTLVALLAAASPAAAQSFAKVGAANQDATGTPPGGTARVLSVGMGVVYREKIQTSAQGSTQLLFPDTSTLNIGRNSVLTIDEFVYDPKANSGSMAATLTRGALRFVGGQISHREEVTFRTPVATLGIRGGVASLSYPLPPALAAADPNLAGCTGQLAVGHFGAVTVRSGGGQVSLRPGFAACVNGAGAPIGAPFRLSEAALQVLMQILTSGPGQRGGAGTPPAGPLLAGQNIGRARLDPPGAPPGTTPLGFNAIVSGGDGAARNQTQGGQGNNVVLPPPVSPPPSTFPGNFGN